MKARNLGIAAALVGSARDFTEVCQLDKRFSVNRTSMKA